MTHQNNTQNAKTTIFNLIILDESGSMTFLAKETIAGCNYLIDTIKDAQERNIDTQRHLVSIFAFQSYSNVPSRYLIKNVDACKLCHISEEIYQPNGATPLYDAIGSTLTDLQAIAATHEDASGVVNIITDGHENSSTRYNLEKVTKIIDACKEQGWAINFIGANIDVQKTSSQLHIHNNMSFQASEAGVSCMMDTLGTRYSTHLDKMADSSNMNLDKEERIRMRKEMNDGFFD